MILASAIVHVQCESENFTPPPLKFFELYFFSNRLFLCIFHTRVQHLNLRQAAKFIQLFLNLRKLCHVKRDHSEIFFIFTKHLPQNTNVCYLTTNKWLKHTSY